MTANLQHAPVWLDQLPTEQRNPASELIDTLSTPEVLRLINHEDLRAPQAVTERLAELGEVVDAMVAALSGGGRVHYFGAGTSGRLAVLDAAEVPPTYGAPAEQFRAHLAGGGTAMTSAVEDAEDRVEEGVAAAQEVGTHDIAIGLAASGRTPYVRGALQEARRRGATTVAITSNPHAPLAEVADHHIALDTGAEVVTGSTRMKAATAQKIALHTLSTATMIRLGHTYSNLMIDVVPTNEKLRRRVIRVLQEATGASAEDAARALDDAGDRTRVALVALLTGVTPDAAAAALAARDGVVRAALADLRGEQAEPGPARAHPRTRAGRALGIDIGASGFRVDVLEVDGSGAGAARRLFSSEVRPLIVQGRIDIGAIVGEIAARQGTLTADAVAAVGIGIAGGSHFPESLNAVAAQFAALWPDASVVCFPDALAAYVGAFGTDAGAVLAAGTGAVAVATDGVTQWRQVDGAGHLLGDLGSGAWIGRAGLQAVLAAEHGRAPVSPVLNDRLNQRFGDARALTRELTRVVDRGAVLASFAPAVFEADEEGEDAARRIVDTAAHELAATVIAAARGIADEIALLGGVFRGSPRLRAVTERLVEEAGFPIRTGALAASAGAARLGQRVATGDLPPVFVAHVVVTHREQ